MKSKHENQNQTSRYLRLISVLLISAFILMAFAGCSKRPSDTEEEPDPVLPEEDVDTAVHAASAEELFKAIAPGAVIVIDEGSYDLTAWLNEKYESDGGDESYPYVSLENSGDGAEIVIRDVEGLSISGESGKRQNR